MEMGTALFTKNGEGRNFDFHFEIALMDSVGVIEPIYLCRPDRTFRRPNRLMLHSLRDNINGISETFALVRKAFELFYILIFSQCFIQEEHG